jgi:hypothetical protein
MKKLLVAAPLGALVLMGGTLMGALAQQPASEAPSLPPPSSITDMTDARTGTMFVAETGDDIMSSRLVGARVVNGTSEAIGEVADLMLSAKGELRAVVLSVGGVMGVGARYVAVAPSALRIIRNPDKSIKVVLEASRDQLTASPEFKYEKRP